MRLDSSQQVYLQRLGSSLLANCVASVSITSYHGLARLSRLFASIAFMADTFSFQEAQRLSWMCWQASSKAPRYCESHRAS